MDGAAKVNAESNVLYKSEHDQFAYNQNVSVVNVNGMAQITLGDDQVVTVGVFAGVPPLPTHRIVGRSEVTAQLRSRLLAGDSSAIASLGGKGGVGKTTLATLLAYDTELLKHFTGGVLWANLGPNPNLDFVLNAWGDALNNSVRDVLDLEAKVAHLQAAIGQRPFLIIIDDVWQADAAALLHRVNGPQCAQLLTTRDDEIAQHFDRRGWQSIGELNEDHARALLGELCPNAVQAAADGISRLVTVVGCLPLAVVLVGGYLATARFRELAKLLVAELLANAVNWLKLNDSEHTVPLEQVIGLSIDRLPDDGCRAAILALAIFAPKPADFSLAAAEAISGANIATINTLVQRNLLEQVGEERLTMHQTIAALAVQRTTTLAADQERHARYYLDLMNADREDWQTIEPEWEQIKHAWRWINSTKARKELVLDYIVAARVYQERRAYWHDYKAWIERGLEVARSSTDLKTRAVLLNHLATAYDRLGDPQQALTCDRRALSMWRRLHIPLGEAASLHGIGHLSGELGNLKQAINYYHKALSLRQRIGAHLGEAITLYILGYTVATQGNWEQASIYYLRALALERDEAGFAWEANALRELGYVVGNVAWEANTLYELGYVTDATGDPQGAFGYYNLVLSKRREVGELLGEANVLDELGYVSCELGNTQQAIEYYQQALPIHRRISDHNGEAIALNNMGAVYAALGNKEQGLEYFEAALAARKQVIRRLTEAVPLSIIGLVCANPGNKQLAFDYFKKTLPIWWQLRSHAAEGVMLHNIGSISFDAGDFIQAHSYFEQALALGEQVSYPDLIRAAQNGLERINIVVGSL